MALLGRGLTFIPTMGVGKDYRRQMLLDMYNYHRRIKLAVYFEEDDEGETSITPFMAFFF